MIELTTEIENDLKLCNKYSQNMVKVSPSKSIAYQNGGSKTENCEFSSDEAHNENCDDTNEIVNHFYSDKESLKNDCLEIMRKKLISDLTITVFSTDLENKLTKIEPIEIPKEKQTIIQKLIVQISQLTDSEKLLLFLKLPSSTSSPFDPLRQPLNPLGNRQEIQQTIVWIKTHLEEDSDISIPKQEVYDQYLKYCDNVSMKPLSTADFGKVMKQVYPGVRPRRLGTRGNSRYCYSGMRNTLKLAPPGLPDLDHQLDVSDNANRTSEEGHSDKETQSKKKAEKPKRKWKSGARKDKCCTLSERCVEESPKETKTAKRSKVEEEANLAGLELSEIKYEGSSDNSFNALDSIDYELGSELSQGLGIYFHNIDDIKKPLVDDIARVMNGVDLNKNHVEEKARRRGSACKVQKIVKKGYVPIQPKPEVAERPDTDKDGLDTYLCDESDSQEPEEEIARYFQHLDEAPVFTQDVLVGQAVVKKQLVQVNDLIDMNRSHSCFLEYNLPGKELTLRSHSVGFSNTLPEEGKKKPSHLRLLLEKTNETKLPGMMPEHVPHAAAAAAPAVTPKPLVPQSPNTRTKYFSFTPISPGPQSPLKTPCTPCASPFLSPRNTPVPRSRQASTHSDRFVPPSKLVEEPGPGTRPRSFSSTNFYRCKPKKKPVAYDKVVTQAQGQAQVQMKQQDDVKRLFTACRFDAVNSCRSQSVPLSGMMPLNNYTLPTYNNYFGLSHTPTPVPTEFSDFPPALDNVDNYVGSDFSTVTSTQLGEELFTGEFVGQVEQFGEPILDLPAPTFTDPTTDDIKFLPNEAQNKLFTNDDDKDPMITSFKPELLVDAFPNSPGLSFFESKITDDNQLIELLNLDA